MIYTPKNHHMWDFWTVKVQSLWHFFYLQAPLSCTPDDRHHLSMIGHATTEDLIHWQEHKAALKPSRTGWDNLALWTGCVVFYDQTYYLFYTGRSQEACYVQKIGLATSHDLIFWKKHQKNPILEADSAYYSMFDHRNERGVFPIWRDPFVFRFPGMKQWQMLLSARTLGDSQDYNACIARAVSDDLINWQIQPPILAPGHFDEMEVPQMIHINGFYYLFFSTFSHHYHPDLASKQGAISGLHAYYSYDYLGPFHPVNGNAVVRPGEDLYAIQLIEKVSKEEAHDHYLAMGFSNLDANGHFRGGLSQPFEVHFKEDLVWVQKLCIKS